MGEGGYTGRKDLERLQMNWDQGKLMAIEEYCADCVKLRDCGYNKIKHVDFGKSVPCRYKQKVKRGKEKK